MTNKQKTEMFAMRLDGQSFQTIGDKFGITRQRAQQIMEASTRARPRVYNWIYPNVVKWCNENNCTAAHLAEKCGITSHYLSGIMGGKRNPSKNVIDKMLKATGVTYEEFFFKV